MEKEVRFTVTMKVMDMFKFQMWYSNNGVKLIANILISGSAIIGLIVGAGEGKTLIRAVLIILALLFPVIHPLQLLNKSLKQVKLNPMFQKPLEYVCNSEGILIKQELDEMLMPWVEVWKTKETKNYIYVLMPGRRAYILPKSSYKEQIDDMKELIRIYVTDRKTKIGESKE